MAFVSSNHKASVAVVVGKINICLVLGQELYNVQVAVETGGSQRRRVARCRVVHVSTGFH